MAPLNDQLTNIERKLDNSVAYADDDALRPIRNDAGENPPAGAPTSIAELKQLPANNLLPLETYYGLPVINGATVTVRRKRIARKYGVKFIAGPTVPITF